MVKLLSISILTLLCIGCSQPKKLTTAGTGNFSVLTYNIHHGNPPTQPKGYIDLDSIAAAIQLSGADVVAIQELDSVTIRSHKTYQLKVLAEKLNMFYHFEQTIPYEGGSYGIGILSKHPIKKISAYRLPHTEGTEPRKVLFATIAYQNEEIVVGCTHIDYKTKAIKISQTADLINKVKEFSNDIIIIGGDFNAAPNDESITQMSSLLVDAGNEKEYTIPVKKPTKKIDYIFYKKHARVSLISSRVLTEHHYGSDHLPVLAGFEIKK
ncbi:endonuclease/exonuclease/phosphatase family protein [Gynurincola endophyticus]|uniref:endonuclease/exonuclease/phosphatase family protein n=1 Tax=Gynurincola endophyticus TaxID=2479004 RepID=UPI000F8E8038|nr:endonuclease/exonuclease/phosphatase family protein [Gynurincola endophyticus]